jgi:hypothetical protein
MSDTKTDPKPVHARKLYLRDQSAEKPKADIAPAVKSLQPATEKSRSYPSDSLAPPKP